jgi:hypothetical protein
MSSEGGTAERSGSRAGKNPLQLSLFDAAADDRP